MPTVEACNFIDEPPEIEYRSGLFHVTQRIGNKHYERVMRPYVFMVALRRAAECARQHKFGGADILPFERPEEDVISA